MLEKISKTPPQNDVFRWKKLKKKNTKETNPRRPLTLKQNTQKDTKSPKRKGQRSTNSKLCPTNKRKLCFFFGFFRVNL